MTVGGGGGGAWYTTLSRVSQPVTKPVARTANMVDLLVQYVFMHLIGRRLGRNHSKSTGISYQGPVPMTAGAS